jgi:hypothetical protein
MTANMIQLPLNFMKEEDPEDDEDWLEEYEVNSDGDYWEEE